MISLEMESADDIPSRNILLLFGMLYIVHLIRCFVLPMAQNCLCEPLWLYG